MNVDQATFFWTNMTAFWNVTRLVKTKKDVIISFMVQAQVKENVIGRKRKVLNVRKDGRRTTTISMK